jgi:Ran GTPase-activating protein 1
VRKHCPRLSTPYKSNCAFNSPALGLCHRYFSPNFRLREINFGDCLLKTRGAVLIADAVQDTHLDLEVLNLEHNEIGPHGGLSVASAMYNKVNLQSLNINGNQFGEEGRLQIQEMMGECDKTKILEPMDENESESENEEENGEEELDDEEEEYDEDGGNGFNISKTWSQGSPPWFLQHS